MRGIPMQYAKVELTIPEQMRPYVHSGTDQLAQVQNALLLHPYIQDDTISYGKAAEILGMNKLDLISLYGKLGIDFVGMSDDEFDDEVKRVKELEALSN